MASKVYKAHGVVLRKTKLAEKDLVVAILDDTGSLVRAVAKGARRPGGSYAARLELFSAVDLVLAQGRNLDVITGATFAQGHAPTLLDMEQTACASALAELVATLAQEDLPNERLYAMTRSAFELIGATAPATALALSCAAMLKAFAYCGFRPSFNTCVLCGDDIGTRELPRQVRFSIAEGGAVCSACQWPSDAFSADATTLNWADALMRARFDEVSQFEPPVGILFEVLHLIRQWSRTHVGKNLKSVDFLLSCGLF